MTLYSDLVKQLSILALTAVADRSVLLFINTRTCATPDAFISCVIFSDINSLLFILKFSLIPLREDLLFQFPTFHLSNKTYCVGLRSSAHFRPLFKIERR